MGEGSLVQVPCVSQIVGSTIGAWCRSTKVVALGWISLVGLRRRVDQSSGAGNARGEAWWGCMALMSKGCAT
ncbi:hypothetical protein AMTR_s00010p00130170 [Amborella trichopoda]|uniref:Uncharacterized protein n=1 Tax=Amborella trichopoda TaxID=13333 RepID=W1NG09_AMBTC|nr:hypothetical protein AMTR_s00010p00130170 [Amborella trichopoda]